MDNTLVLEDTGDLWGKFLEIKNIVNETDIQKRLKLNADYAEEKMDPAEYFQFEISLIQKIPSEEKENWRKEFFEKCVKPCISPRGLSLIQDYKENKDNMIVLITATLSYIASPVADYAGVHDLIATEAEIEDEIYTGKVSGIACLQEGKIDRFNTWLKANSIISRNTVLYSDSINDLPLLNFVKEPIAVDPDQYLKKIAQEKNWKIMSFK